MSTRTCVARALCVVLTTTIGAVLRPAHAVEIASSRPAEAKRGFLLDRLSRSDVRTWRAIEEVVAASDASGAPRSPTLRRLWEWARTSTHALHVEMVSPSKLAAGMVGVFRVEHFDPAGQSHVTVIRLSPQRIRYAKANSGANAVLSFDRFEGLTEVERYAEVLAHELAHAVYFLESPERLAQLQAAERAIEEFLYRAGRRTGPAHKEIGHWCASSLAVLDASEAHAESVEAVVLRELAATKRLPGAAEGNKPAILSPANWDGLPRKTSILPDEKRAPRVWIDGARNWLSTRSLRDRGTARLGGYGRGLPRP